jgi:hypothetical protein
MISFKTIEKEALNGEKERLHYHRGKLRGEYATQGY